MNDRVTIDLDFCDKENLRRIVLRILNLPCCYSIDVKHSFSKGYHLIVTCKNTSCDFCRFVFDDANRYSMDRIRRTEEQNVLWETARSLKGVSVKPETTMAHRPEP